jgi:hypothetical protein
VTDGTKKCQKNVARPPPSFHKEKKLTLSFYEYATGGPPKQAGPPHPAPPRQLVDAVRSRYPLWATLGLDSIHMARQHPLPW